MNKDEGLCSRCGNFPVNPGSDFCIHCFLLLEYPEGAKVNASDVVGYIGHDGTVFCPGCAPYPAHMDPVFAGSEWDYYPTCDTCHGVIDDVGLTCYGCEQEKLRKFFSLLHDERQARKFKVILSSPDAAV